MDVKAMLWNSPPPPPRKPRPVEPVWTLAKAVRRVDAQLLGHGEYGWEIQLLRDGGFYFGRRFTCAGRLSRMAMSFGGHLKLTAIPPSESHRA